jgi:hypothetical protein
MMLAKADGTGFVEEEVMPLLDAFLRWVEAQGLETTGTWGLAQCNHDDRPDVPGFDAR